MKVLCISVIFVIVMEQFVAIRLVCTGLEPMCNVHQYK